MVFGLIGVTLVVWYRGRGVALAQVFRFAGGNAGDLCEELVQVFGLAGLLKNVTLPCLEARNFDARSDDEIVTPERVGKMRTRFILRPCRALIVHRIKPRASLALHPWLTYFALSGLGWKNSEIWKEKHSLVPV